MQTIEQRRVLITGGSRGLGLGVVEALVAQHANVTVVARDSARLTELKARLGVSIIPGDATDPMLAESVLREVPIGTRAQRRLRRRWRRCTSRRSNRQSRDLCQAKSAFYNCSLFG